MFLVQEGGFKIFLCGTRDEKIILRFSTPAKKNVPWKWGVEAVWNSCSQADVFFLLRRGGRGEGQAVAPLSST